MNQIIRTYNELTKLKTYNERLKYLQICGSVGEDTFGSDRYINQLFYSSKEWKDVKRYVILRDAGCDLGLSGFEIYNRIIVHHMNPITVEDILNTTEFLYNPEYLICTSMETHNAIHYKKEQTTKLVERSKDDTILWKRR